MKVLTVCEHGNIRSVALAYLIKTIYKHDVIACGMESNSQETLKMLFAWADKIIFLDSQLLTNSYMPVLANGNPAKLSAKVECLDVGEDVWHDAKAQELNHKLMKGLKGLNL